LPPPGSVALVRVAQRPPAAAVAWLYQAYLMLLEAVVVAAFWAIDRCLALRRVAALLMPQVVRSRAVKIQEERPANPVSPGA
jgi:hypothetical protein